MNLAARSTFTPFNVCAISSGVAAANFSSESIPAALSWKERASPIPGMEVSDNVLAAGACWTGGAWGAGAVAAAVPTSGIVVGCGCGCGVGIIALPALPLEIV